MDSKTIIRIQTVTKRFGPAVAVRNVSLDLAEGEFFCLLGPSGCGKSTLMRMIAGFEEPDEGRIELDGADLVGTPPERRPLNMMFQSYALFPHMTVSGNIAYGLRRGGLDKAEQAARLAEMIRIARLDGFETRYPAQLSGGQRQRVALARALARRPRVLLLDEPLGALDRSLRESTQAELKELQARLGTTFVMVTHDQDEAMSLADRIGIMQAGSLIQAGSPREVYERPASRFVAGFIGAANLIEGTIIRREPVFARIALADGTEIEARAETGEPGDAVAVMVRPEHLSLAAGDVPGPNRLAATVTATAFLGDGVSIRARLASGQDIRVLAHGGAPEPLRGEAITLAFAADAARVVT
ncbi:ABC transporter ATP-binding protein [Enterovirga rhinocerotis]|uniref:Putrescine transport system ATP-binding protein n=1 Tax=Enterovirga rhinocerotis TaxID=1339210 RepID=A0A4R7BU61_9HYPH|nr:ABC transporter ATP-binding protein [Enterovirga rhinocerotis]TDR89041.1 putrescine transport system ATP-binding protein [Enterovirga rhinocerotis]